LATKYWYIVTGFLLGYSKMIAKLCRHYVNYQEKTQGQKRGKRSGEKKNTTNVASVSPATRNPMDVTRETVGAKTKRSDKR